jgi:hypothetical protein
MPEKTSTKTAATDDELLVDEPAAEAEESTTLEPAVGYAMFDVPDFQKRHASLELAITANSPDPVATARTFYAFLAETSEGGAA